MAAVAAGFADPVHDAQRAFRAVMRAMARPGRIESLAADAAPPAPLPLAAAAACLTLADFETPLWLSPRLERDHAVGSYLRFHTGAPVAAAPGHAAFAVVDLRADTLDFATFAQGTAEYPDRSATLVLIVDALDETGPLALTGPGIRDSVRFGFAPMPPDFLTQWARNRAGFPLGVDLILAAGERLACLPRSARILAEAA